VTGQANATLLYVHIMMIYIIMYGIRPGGFRIPIQSPLAGRAAAAGSRSRPGDRRRSLGGSPTDAAASIRAIRVPGKSVTAVRASLRVSEMVRDPQGLPAGAAAVGNPAP
jgi:hypothetical protein